MSFQDEDFIERELMNIRRRLSRSNDRIIAGVCAGIAEFLGWKPASIRALFVLGVVLSFGWFVVVYLLLWWMMPPAGGFQLDNFRKQ